MAPLGGEPGVVEIEPADKGADIESGRDWIEFKFCAGHATAIGNYRPGHNGSKKLSAGGIMERQQSAAQAVHQTVAGGIESFATVDSFCFDVLGDFLKEGIKGWTEV